MARVIIPVTHVSRFGFTSNASEVTGDAANDHYVVNDGATWIEVRNTVASTRTFDVEVPANVDVTQTVSVRTYTVPASGSGKTGIFPREFYGETILLDVANADLRFTAYTTL